MTSGASISTKRPPDWFSLGLGGLSALFIGGLLLVLCLWIREAWPALAAYGGSFVSGREWFYRDQKFGPLP